MLHELVGGEEGTEVFETEQRLEGAVHVASVTDVVQTSQRDLFNGDLLILLVILAVESDLTGLIMIVLVIGPALIGAVKHLIAHASHHQTLLLHALLAVSLHFPLIYLITLEHVSHFNNQGVGSLDILVNLLLFVSLLGELPAFDSEGAIFDGLHHGLHDGIGGDVAVSLPYLYLKVVVGDSAVLTQECFEVLEGPEVGK